MLSISGNVLNLMLRVTQPGDWIGVITAPAPIPVPAAGLLLPAALFGMGIVGRRRKSRA